MTPIAKAIGAIGAIAAVVLLAAALGCGQRLTREEQIELRRAEYSATLQSLTVEQDPVLGDPAAGKVDTTAPLAPVVHTAAILDMVVSTTSETPLPGVTLDVAHLDAARQPKERTTVWVDTSALARGQSIQVTHQLENVSWQTGDAYAVEVRSPIPPEERAGYREFEVPAR